MRAVETIGRIAIPAAVLDHRFVHEAQASAMLLTNKQDPTSQVVGTANTRACELYGWAPNVDSHDDRTGFVYLCMLNPGRGTLFAFEGAMGDQVVEEPLEQGAVIRLNDFCEHWTEDRIREHRVAAFVGSWPEPNDAEALALLQAGIAALERGDYYGAPRVREGFRVLLADECLAANAAFDALEPMLLADAKAQGRYVETCAQCSRPAVRPDSKWPHFIDQSRCRVHLGERKRAARTQEMAHG
jgi:hypothetical protein